MRLLFTLFICAAASLTFAQTGYELDTDFGASGETSTDLGFSGEEQIVDMAFQADGKIVAVAKGESGGDSEMVVIRYNADGSLDNSFATSGKFTTSLSASSDDPSGIEIQSDGKIVVSGSFMDTSGTSKMLAFRLNTDGTTDASFGGAGFVSIGTNGEDEFATDVKIQSDGKIVLSGYDAADNGWAVRLMADGSFDATFDGDGYIAFNHSRFQALDIQSDGKIVLVGSASATIGSTDDYAIFRLTTGGTLDASFDSDGVVTIDNDPIAESATAIDIQSDGKLLVGGGSGTFGFAVFRFNDNGSLDNSFSGDGSFNYSVSLTASDDEMNSIAVDADGMIVLGGTSVSLLGGTALNSTLISLNSDGSFNVDFDLDDGIITSALLSSNASTEVVKIDADGKIVVGGSTSTGGDEDASVARYRRGTVGINDAVVSNDMNLYPNPVTANTVLSYTLDKQTDITVELIDMQGRTIAVYADGETQFAGEHRMSLDIPADLANGTYQLRIAGNNAQQTLPLVKTH